MFDANKITELFDKLISDWHKKEYDIAGLDNQKGLKRLLIKLLFHNYTLWHLEDNARALNVSDSIIADVKRKIDRQNQLRNDTIELIDSFIEKKTLKLQKLKKAFAPTETLGAAIDRLSIISLKIFHMREETLRKDADNSHINKCCDKLNVLQIQRSDLAGSINLTREKILSGELIHRIYRQMKMYNDPSLNPVLYKLKNKK